MTPNRSRTRIEIQRLISVGQDRKTGDTIIKGTGPLGRDVWIHIHPSQLRKLADGVMGRAKARAESAGD